jgi:hypothetical protein
MKLEATGNTASFNSDSNVITGSNNINNNGTVVINNYITASSANVPSEEIVSTNTTRAHQHGATSLPLLTGSRVPPPSSTSMQRDVVVPRSPQPLPNTRNILVRAREDRDNPWMREKWPECINEIQRRSAEKFRSGDNSDSVWMNTLAMYSTIIKENHLIVGDRCSRYDNRVDDFVGRVLRNIYSYDELKRAILLKFGFYPV